MPYTPNQLQHYVDTLFQNHGLTLTAIECDPATRRRLLQMVPVELRSVDSRGVTHIGDAIPITVVSSDPPAFLRVTFRIYSGREIEGFGLIKATP